MTPEERLSELRRFLYLDLKWPTSSEPFVRDPEQWQAAMGMLLESTRENERPWVVERVLEAIEVFGDEPGHWSHGLLRALPLEDLSTALILLDRRPAKAVSVGFMERDTQGRRRPLLPPAHARSLLLGIAAATGLFEHARAFAGGSAVNEQVVARLFMSAPQDKAAQLSCDLELAGIDRVMQMRSVLSGKVGALSPWRRPPDPSEIFHAIAQGPVEMLKVIRAAVMDVTPARDKSHLFPSALVNEQLARLDARIALLSTAPQGPAWTSP